MLSNDFLSLDQKAFDQLICDIIFDFHKNGPVNLSHLETLAILKHKYPEWFCSYESKILYTMGLFYKTIDPISLFELSYNIYALSIQQQTGRLFTPIQAETYNSIKKYDNYSFSAPTSTGKSYLFQELILESEGDVIIVVPTRALLAEYLFKIKKIAPKDTLVLPFIEIVNTKKISKKIFIITPERSDEIFEKLEYLNIELFLFDEAQLSEDGIRGMKFDSLIRRVDKVFPKAKKVFTHPFVVNPEAQLEKHHLIHNSNSKLHNQNNVGKIFVEYKRNSFRYFSPYDDQSDNIYVNEDPIESTLINGGTCLFYVSKKDICDSSILMEFSKYIDLCDDITDPEALRYIHELESYFGVSPRKQSNIINLMKKGIVLHHGSMPLTARYIIEKFVNNNHARICFSTSTLTQGINMPFDLVWIKNYKFMGSTDDKKCLDLKNLIGRAGRTSSKKLNQFEYGIIIVESKNRKSFELRLRRNCEISNKSILDEDINNINIDYIDTIEAIKNNTFNTLLNLPNIQIQRLTNAEVDDKICFLLDQLIDEVDMPITGNNYYNLSIKTKDKIKLCFKSIFATHLRRQELTSGESAVLSTAIPILLWQIQGKSFSEIISLRYSYLSREKELNDLKSKLKRGELSAIKFKTSINAMIAKYSCIANPIPDSTFIKSVPLFRKVNIENISFDQIIYDTYDYLDKVLALSLRNPLHAAFMLYYNETKDNRALILSNYIKYGTNDEREILLIKYGFSFEDIEWINSYIDNISEEEIIFNESIKELLSDHQKMQVIERFL